MTIVFFTRNGALQLSRRRRRNHPIFQAKWGVDASLAKPSVPMVFALPKENAKADTVSRIHVAKRVVKNVAPLVARILSLLTSVARHSNATTQNASSTMNVVPINNATLPKRVLVVAENVAPRDGGTFMTMSMDANARIPATTAAIFAKTAWNAVAANALRARSRVAVTGKRHSPNRARNAAVMA